MPTAIDVEVDPGHDGGLTGEEEVLRVGAPGRSQQHPAALGDSDVADEHGVGLRPRAGVLALVPPRDLPQHQQLVVLGGTVRRSGPAGAVQQG